MDYCPWNLRLFPIEMEKMKRNEVRSAYSIFMGSPYGVLEVTLAKAKEEKKPKGEPIEIE